MYKKIESMINLDQKMGLNMHTFVIPKTKEEFVNTVKSFELCTMRTDHANKTQGLPFYVFDVSKQGIEELDKIWHESEKEQYKLIVSNGYKYDPIQSYNMVVKMSEDGEFMLEASPEKVPLRHMYRYPLLSCCGSIWKKPNEWQYFNEIRNFNRLHLFHDLFKIYQYGIFDKWLEVTVYPKPVGMKQDTIVFWQVV